MKHWIVLDRGSVPPAHPGEFEFLCRKCRKLSLLPVLGTPYAQTERGVLFELGESAIPRRVRCPHCSAELIAEEQEVA